MKVYVEVNSLYTEEVKYIFSVFAFNKGVKFEWINDVNYSDLSIGHSSKNTLRISIAFYEQISSGIFDHNFHFKNGPNISFEDGEHDLLSTAFYVLTCAQELGSSEKDKFGRFQFKNSFQAKFNVEKENLVQMLFDKLETLLSSKLPARKKSFRSRIFLSHDIDTVYGALMQDGFSALKRFRFDQVFKIILSNLLKGPSWKNIDRIMDIESEYDFYSTFFWLVNKGRVDENLSNSDYDLNDNVIQRFISEITSGKWSNGLHKSAADDSFQKELLKLGVSVKANRYHYLKFDLKTDFPLLAASPLSFDSSLGFAEASGFRSGYGQPYRPYDFSQRRALDFIECPLNIMDTTAFNYKKLSGTEFLSETISFCERNSTNCVISVLFHNNIISDYKFKDYLVAFKKLLAYFYESGLKPIGPEEIITEYYYEY